MIGLKILLGLILTTTVTNVSATHLMSQCVKATSKIKMLGCIMRLTIDFGGGGGPMNAVKRVENYRREWPPAGGCIQNLSAAGSSKG